MWLCETTAIKDGAPITFVKYAWCVNCWRYLGVTSSVTNGFTFTDPLSLEDRVRLESSGESIFFGALNLLWEEGALPQIWTMANERPTGY